MVWLPGNAQDHHRRLLIGAPAFLSSRHAPRAVPQGTARGACLLRAASAVVESTESPKEFMPDGRADHRDTRAHEALRARGRAVGRVAGRSPGRGPRPARAERL